MQIPSNKFKIFISLDVVNNFEKEVKWLPIFKRAASALHISSILRHIIFGIS